MPNFFYAPFFLLFRVFPHFFFLPFPSPAPFTFTSLSLSNSLHSTFPISLSISLAFGLALLAWAFAGVALTGLSFCPVWVILHSASNETLGPVASTDRAWTGHGRAQQRLDCWASYLHNPFHRRVSLENPSRKLVGIIETLRGVS